MTRTRIKCCGVTRVEDALLAVGLGVDAIGMVFTRRSKRCITLAPAQAIRRALPPFVTSVALFMDDDPAWVRQVMQDVQPDLLQFHGAESDAWCTRFGWRYLKAIAMGEGSAALARLREFPGATGLLLDGHGLGQAGGSGKVFDWSLIPQRTAQPVILAGGLHAGNVAEAIRVARPWAVDVSSGIEASPGIKDPDRLRAFVAAVRSVPDAPA